MGAALARGAVERTAAAAGGTALTRLCNCLLGVWKMCRPRMERGLCMSELIDEQLIVYGGAALCLDTKICSSGKRLVICPGSGLAADCAAGGYGAVRVRGNSHLAFNISVCIVSCCFVHLCSPRLLSSHNEHRRGSAQGLGQAL
jgi:hypothetical protein